MYESSPLQGTAGPELKHHFFVTDLWGLPIPRLWGSLNFGFVEAEHGLLKNGFSSLNLRNSNAGLFNRFPHVPMCRKNCPDILDPIPIIGMSQSVHMCKEMRIMAMRILCTRSRGMQYFPVIRF